MKKLQKLVLAMSGFLMAVAMLAEPSLAAVRTKINSKDGAEMVYVPAGTFTMGSNYGNADEKPPHQVTLGGYWIYKNEVTVAQFNKFRAATGYRAPFDGYSKIGTHPIEHDWDAAQAYCKWAGVQLPTEAQWEKAARGTDGRQYPWGNQFDKTKCWGGQRPALTTKPVGSFPQGASPYGCLDMAGNVWEWCSDFYGNYSATSVTDPLGPVSGIYRVARGGEADSSPINCRTTARNGCNSGSGHGFRCVLADYVQPAQQAAPQPPVQQPVAQQPVQSAPQSKDAPPADVQLTSTHWIIAAIDSRIYPNQTEPITQTNIYNFALSDLDPQTVGVWKSPVTPEGKYFVFGDTSYGKHAIHRHSQETWPSFEAQMNQNRDDDVTSVQFYCEDKDTADRVAKAFAHAIRLSGGQVTKKDLF